MQIRVTNTGYLGPKKKKKKKFLCDTVVRFPFLHHTVYKDKCVDNSRQHFLAFNVSPLKNKSASCCFIFHSNHIKVKSMLI